MTPYFSPGRVNILGVGISTINMTQALEQMFCLVDRKQRTYIVVCSVYPIMLSQFHPSYRHILNRAGLITPDGMPLVFLSRWMGHKHVERVYGPDLMLAFSEVAAQRGYTNFFYGGADGIPELLADKLTERFSDLKIVGTYSPPFRPLTPEEDQKVIDMINAAQPDVVWVGLGCPKQDLWMIEHRDKLNAPILIGVGAAFDILSGRQPQAPRWMQRNALEWLFRLYHEPRRLWRRYLIYNPLFILLVLLQTIGIRRLKVSATPIPMLGDQCALTPSEPYPPKHTVM